MDDRLKLLSYSSLLTLHACPRKFQLYRLNATEDELDPLASINQTVTFAFGHVVGQGVQDVMAGMSEQAIILRAFTLWYADLEDRNIKQCKSFYQAINAIQRFISLRENGFLDEYELVEFNSKPAVELSFKVNFPDGFRLRGSVDAVLIHKITGEVLVLECKTSSSNISDAAQYKNSSQAIGYSVVLDVLFPEVSSYTVMYLVYQTKDMTYIPINFTKTYLQRASWIQELLLDVEIIKMYENAGVYPTRGENCFDFYRACEYLNTCTLSTSYLIKANAKVEDSKVYDVVLDIQDLIAAQLKKAGNRLSSGNGGESESDTNMNVGLLEGDTIL